MSIQSYLFLLQNKIPLLAIVDYSIMIHV